MHTGDKLFLCMGGEENIRIWVYKMYLRRGKGIAVINLILSQHLFVEQGFFFRDKLGDFSKMNFLGVALSTANKNNVSH